MVCLETTFIIDLLRGKPEIKELKDEFDKEDIISITAPSVMELWAGALMAKLPEKEKAKINELILSMIVLRMDEKSAKEAGEIEAELIKSGNIIEIEDLMIAGIAKANGEKLVTNDEHYAKIPGLKMIKY